MSFSESYRSALDISSLSLGIPMIYTTDLVADISFLTISTVLFTFINNLMAESYFVFCKDFVSSLYTIG